MKSILYTHIFLPPIRYVWQSHRIKDDEKLLAAAGNMQTIWKGDGTGLPPGASVLLDYGRELHGGLRFVTGRHGADFSAEKKMKIRLRFGESVSEAMAEPNNQHAIHDTELDLAPMGETLYGNTGFRFVRIDNLDPELTLNLLECSAHLTQFPQERRGFFHSSDPLLNRIWECCGNTLDCCMYPLLIDGAKRDRLVWTGDLYSEIRAAVAFYGKHPQIAATLDYLKDETLPTGVFNGIPEYLPYWFMSHWEYFRYCGDRFYLSEQAEAFSFFAEKLLAVFEKNEEKLWETSIIDWSNSIGSKQGYWALYAAGIAAAISLAKFFREEKIELRATAIFRRIRRKKTFPNPSKAVGALAVMAGVLPPRMAYDTILSQDSRRGLSTFHFDLILGAYSAAGKTAEALSLLRNYYGGMIRLGATSFWEQFEMDWLCNAARIDEMQEAGKNDIHRNCGSGCFAGYRHSLCHGWAAAPAAWMMENLLGLSPHKPGFETMRVSPNLCDLDYLEGTCPTPHGPIRISCKKGKPAELDCPHAITVIYSRKTSRK